MPQRIIIPIVIAIIVAFELLRTGAQFGRAAESLPCLPYAQEEVSTQEPESSQTQETKTEAQTQQPETNASNQVIAPKEEAVQSTPQEPQPVPRPHIIFSELFPDPEGKDEDNEFIELHNTSSFDADLTGWKIIDAKERVFPLTITIGTKSYYALTYAETKIPLTNTGTTLSLVSPDGDIVESISYSKPIKTNETLSRNEKNVWQWTKIPTPGGKNIFEEESEQPVQKESSEQQNIEPEQKQPTPIIKESSQDIELSTTESVPLNETQSQQIPTPVPQTQQPIQINPQQEDSVTPEEQSPPKPNQTVEQIKQLADGAEVTLQAVVVLPPGRAGKTIFTVTDNTGNIFVRSTTSLPLLKSGAVVSLIGTMTTNTKAERYVKTSAKKITMLGESFVYFTDITWDDMPYMQSGSSVVVKGVILRKNTTSLVIGDNETSEELRVILPKDEISTEIMKGDFIIARGVFRTTSDGKELLTTKEEDIIFQKSEIPEQQNEAGVSSVVQEEQINEPQTITAQEKSRDLAATAPAIILPGLLAVAGVIWRWKRMV